MMLASWCRLLSIWRLSQHCTRSYGYSHRPCTGPNRSPATTPPSPLAVPLLPPATTARPCKRKLVSEDDGPRRKLRTTTDSPCVFSRGDVVAIGMSANRVDFAPTEVADHNGQSLCVQSWRCGSHRHVCQSCWLCACGEQYFKKQVWNNISEEVSCWDIAGHETSRRTIQGQCQHQQHCPRYHTDAGRSQWWSTTNH